MSEKVGKGFSLVMELEDPRRLGELMAQLASDRYKPRIQKALASLDYVHYARFLPVWERGLLLIVTEFDGSMNDYVMDFAAVLDDEFSLILSYMKGQPPLPVSRYPDKFWEYVDKNTGPKPPHSAAYPEPFSAYPGVTALEIAGAARNKTLPEPKTAEPEPDPKDWLHDVQAHTLRAYKATFAWHYGFEFGAAEQGREMLAALSSRLSRASTDPRDEKLCITLGLTHAGLQALGLPQSMLEQFPVAFREGPRLRSERLGDIGRSVPGRWKVAGYDENHHPVVVHGMVSVYTNADQETLDAGVRHVIESIGALASKRFERTAHAIGTEGEVHFGYRDGIGQPRFTAIEAAGTKSGRPVTPAGDLLLGPRFRNSRGGYYIGELPPALASNGTYAALRVISQDVPAFEQFLQDVKRQHQVDTELLAAKLVGRWRNGSPLNQYPSQPHSEGCKVPAALLDGFGFTAREYPIEAQALAETGEPPSPVIDDREGRRCPFGAHIRRLNPRDGMVLGVPWGRRIVRRGMPYTTFDENHEIADRGLIGLFLCGDLESQFEFIQHVWANQDLSAPGLRNSLDPFSSACQLATPFRFRPKESEAEITVMVPPLTTTIGSVYLFMPGIEGLKWLAEAGWNANAKADAAHTNPSPKTSKVAAMDTPSLDATSPRFLHNPYETYAKYHEAGIGHVDKPYDTHWVFSHELVSEVCRRVDEFKKPGENRTGDDRRPFTVANHLKDGLFFMDPPRHGQALALMWPVFKAAIADVEPTADRVAGELLEKAMKEKGAIDAVGGYAGPLARRVFFRVMGVPPGADEIVLDGWLRSALMSHRETMLPQQRAEGGTATFAMRTYFIALAELVRKAGDPHHPDSIIAGISKATAPQASGGQFDPVEAMNTAVHMALGGYLSTEFLISSGIYNLLRHPRQWQLLRGNIGLLPKAIDEMLRFDAPFQLADRWAQKGTRLGNVTFDKDTVFAIAYGSVNRDPAFCADRPETFDIERELPMPKVQYPKDAIAPVTPNLGFGDGIHRCIGEALGRTVTKAAIKALVERCPTARIGEVGPWGADPYFRQLTRLQLLLR